VTTTICKKIKTNLMSCVGRYADASNESYLHSKDVSKYLVGKVDATDAECICRWDDAMILIYNATNDFCQVPKRMGRKEEGGPDYKSCGTCRDIIKAKVVKRKQAGKCE